MIIFKAVSFYIVKRGIITFALKQFFIICDVQQVKLHMFKVLCNDNYNYYDQVLYNDHYHWELF